MMIKYLKVLLNIFLGLNIILASIVIVEQDSLLISESTYNEVQKEILPNETLKNLKNKPIEIYSYLDSGPMLISFWFLACEPCKKEMKFLDEFNEKYNEYGFKVVSINTDNSRAFKSVKPFVKSKKYSFDVLSDPRSKYFRKLGGNICPYTVIVDKGGAIVSKHVGYSPGDEIELEKHIVSLLDTSIVKPVINFDSAIKKDWNNSPDSTDNEN